MDINFISVTEGSDTTTKCQRLVRGGRRVTLFPAAQDPAYTALLSIRGSLVFSKKRAWSPGDQHSIPVVPCVRRVKGKVLQIRVLNVHPCSGGRLCFRHLLEVASRSGEAPEMLISECLSAAGCRVAFDYSLIHTWS